MHERQANIGIHRHQKPSLHGMIIDVLASLLDD